MTTTTEPSPTQDLYTAVTRAAPDLPGQLRALQERAKLTGVAPADVTAVQRALFATHGWNR